MRLQRLYGNDGPLQSSSSAGTSIPGRPAEPAGAPAVRRGGDDGTQLSMLGSVLNGLETGASAMRGKLLDLRGLVREGTYRVDPAILSRRIVNDSLAGRA
jgi:hypothetical protein